MKSIHLPLLLTLALTSVVGCRGPQEDQRPLRLTIEPSLLTHQWGEGPRQDAADARLRAQAKRFAQGMFAGDPMPTEVPADSADLSDELSQVVRGTLKVSKKAPPAWSQGTPEPARSQDHDLPKPWPVEVKQGEDIRLLARWAGTTAEAIRDENRERLGRRKWLRVGDRLTFTMSANQKYAFEQARQGHERDRLANYFATRHVSKVVVYRIKRGDSIGKAAAQFGDVPVWLLAEFNQTDFRRLKPRDEILIPVVEEYDRERGLPPELHVVDEDGLALTGERLERIEGRLRDDLLGRARMAIDDSNVFERRAGSAAPQPRLSDVGGVPLPTYGAVPGATSGSAAGLPSLHPTPLPRFVAGAAPAAPPGERLAAPSAPAPAPEPAAEPVKVRQVIVKSREVLGHYTRWSGLGLQRILDANPGLNPDRIFVGKKLRLPLDDDAWAAFVTARADFHMTPAEKKRLAAFKAEQAEQARHAAAQAAPRPDPREVAQQTIASRRRAAAAAPTHPAAPAPRGELLATAIRRAPTKPQDPPPRDIGIRPAMVPEAKPAVVPSRVTDAPPPANPTPAPQVDLNARAHRVKPGETATSIARRYRISVHRLRRLNPREDLDLLRIGTRLKLR